MSHLRRILLVSALLTPVLFLMPQTPPTNTSGTFMGVDTSPKIDDTALRGSYGANVPGNVSNMQGQLNVGGAAPGMTSVPPVDPYVRDANGNLTYDAIGNPVMKPPAQLAAEQAAHDAAVAQMNTNNTSTAPGNGSYSIPDYTLTTEQANNAKVQPPGTAPVTALTTTAVNVPPSTIDPNAFSAANGNMAIWGGGATSGLSTAGGTVVIDPAAGDAAVNAVSNMLGGGATTVTNIGDPGTPTVLALPPVCKCCGAPFSKKQVVDGTTPKYTASYGAIAEVIQVCSGPCGDVINRARFQAVWWGPGPAPRISITEPDYHPYRDCFDYIPPEGGQLMVSATLIDPMDPEAATLPPVPDSLVAFAAQDGTWMGTTGPCYYMGGQIYYTKLEQWVDVPTYAMADVCDNGHRQDKPCPVP